MIDPTRHHGLDIVRAAAAAPFGRKPYGATNCRA
jgi:hypothetical protein